MVNGVKRGAKVLYIVTLDRRYVSRLWRAQYRCEHRAWLSLTSGSVDRLVNWNQCIAFCVADKSARRNTFNQFRKETEVVNWSKRTEFGGV